jgi:hypothetical protein
MLFSLTPEDVSLILEGLRLAEKDTGTRIGAFSRMPAAFTPDMLAPLRDQLLRIAALLDKFEKFEESE